MNYDTMINLILDHFLEADIKKDRIVFRAKKSVPRELHVPNWPIAPSYITEKPPTYGDCIVAAWLEKQKIRFNVGSQEWEKFK